MRKRVPDTDLSRQRDDTLIVDKFDGAAKEDMHDDRANICLLLFLYLLQGVPLGLTAAVPLLLQNRHVSYAAQAGFSLAFWPFSVKLAWAPLVDACYVRRWGRRKTWLVPVQYAIGLFLLLLASHSEWLMGADGGGGGGDGVAGNSSAAAGVVVDNPYANNTANSAPPPPPAATPPAAGAVNVPLLTVVFFALNVLAATQDIAVDGWALTMLSRRNVAHASTCNSVGQSAGYFLGFVVFVALESADFANRYWRRQPLPHGLVTFAGFMQFWSVVFMVTTTAVMLFKRETDSDGDRTAPVPASSPATAPATASTIASVRHAYVELWNVLRLAPIRSLIAILLTVKVGFAAADAVSGLKLIEAGVPREQLALMAVPMTPLQVLLPLAISRYTTGPRPLNLFLAAMPYRLVIGVVIALVIGVTPHFRQTDDTFPSHYYVLVFSVLVLHQVASYCMFVAVMAFFARISDPSVGGTYMTLLNTVTNLGGNWPSTLMLWLVDKLTWSHCSSTGLQCTGPLRQSCEASGGVCHVSLDGYHVETVACTVIGFGWLLWRRRQLLDMQRLDISAWRCSSSRRLSTSR